MRKMSMVPVLVALMLTACSSGGRYLYEEEWPKGLPKPARAFCREEAASLADAELATAPEKYREGAANPLVRQCLEAMFRADCSVELVRHAEELERRQKDMDPFFFRFPGAWDRDAVEEETEAQKEALCQSLPSKLEALAIYVFHGARNRYGGRIPWPSKGWAAPGSNRCRDGCTVR